MGDGVYPPWPLLLAEGRTKITITITSMSMSGSRSGAVGRISVRGRRDDPPGPPFVRGGKGGAGLSLERGALIGSLAGDAVHPPGPPL